MHNIIIISLLISTFINFIKNKGKSPVFNCGIWAFMGANSRGFNKDKFNMLGVFNDDRGGDAAGFLSGQNVKHMAGKKYLELIQEYVVPFPKHNIVLGHSRKASSGGKLPEYTQPYCYAEKDVVVGGAIHNGTLFNNDELKLKYKVPEKFIYAGVEYDPNDTQILAYILIKQKNFDVLKEYRGAAAIIWENKEDGLGYIFKGSSRKYNYKTSDVEEERPLFSYTNKKGIWLSSIESPLWMIAEEEAPEIESVKENTILVVKDGIVVDEIPIDRSDSAQVKDYNSNVYGYAQYTNSNNNISSSQLELPLISAIIAADPASPLYVFAHEAKKLTGNRDSLQYASGRYYIFKSNPYGSRLANGVIYVDEFGYPTTKYDKDAKAYYFIEGVMFPNHTTHQATTKLLKRVKKGKLVPAGWYSSTPMEIKKIAIMMENSVYPVTNIRHEYLYTTWGIYDKINGNGYTGSFAPLFGNKTYNFFQGRLTSVDPGQYRWGDHKIEESANNNILEVSIKNKAIPAKALSFFEEGSYYKKEEDNEVVVIKYEDALDHYGVNFDGVLYYIDSDETWIKSTIDEWLSHSTKEAPEKNTSSREISDEEKLWYEESYQTEVVNEFEKVVLLLDNIENSATTESWLSSSKTVQTLVDELKNTIKNSELNIA